MCAIDQNSPECNQNVDPTKLFLAFFHIQVLTYVNLCKISYIFQSLNLVDIPWSVPKSGRTNMVSTYHFYRLSAVPLCFGFCAQVAWTYDYIEYRHPE